MKDAARYLKLTLSGVKYHVYQSGKLVGDLVGGTRVFTQDELNVFRDRKTK